MTIAGTPPRFALSTDELRRIEHIDRLAAGAGAGHAGHAGDVATLVDMLDEPSWTVRRAVVAALAAAGPVAVVPLCDALRNRRENETRIAATVDALSAVKGNADSLLADMVVPAGEPAVMADVAQILGRRRTVTALPTLMKLTQHVDDNVAVAAVEALGRIGGRAAVDSLIDSVRSGNFFRTFAAVDVLGRSGDPRAIAPLISLLEQPQFSTEAARALGRTGDSAAVIPLTHILERAAGATVRVAALALRDLHQRHAERLGGSEAIAEAIQHNGGGSATVRHLVHALVGGDPQEQAAICFVLGALRDESAAPTLTGLLDASSPVTEAAADALRRLGPKGDAQVLQDLVTGNSASRKVLLPLVSRISATEQVVQCLSDADADVRAFACDALGRMGAVNTVSMIFPLLADDNPRVSFAAIAAIQSLGSRETQRLALSAARSNDARVRRAAMRILAYFGMSTALDVFIDGLTDSDERVRESAIHGLPFIEEQRALDALLTATKSPVPRTRAAVMRALAQCAGDLRATAYLVKGLGDTDPWVRYYACQALGKLAYEPAAESIIRLLDDPAGQVRVAAVEALSCLKAPLAQVALKSAVVDAEADVQRAAIVGLGVAKQADSLPVLLAATVSPDSATRLVALSALVGFKTAEVLPALERAAHDEDASVRTAAIGFISAMAGVSATTVLAGLLRAGSNSEQVVAALSVNIEGRVAGLLGALETADDETASALTSALARLRRADATAALVSAMRLKNTSARKAAATTLGGMGTSEALEALKVGAQQDSDHEVRQICALLLAR